MKININYVDTGTTYYQFLAGYMVEINCNK